MNDLYFIVLGLLIGSFLGVVIDRLPINKSIVSGRSQCEFCQRDLTALELIPIFSFLFQKGKCRKCHRNLSWRYPLLEFITAIAFWLTYRTSGISIQTGITLIFVSILIVIAFIDIDTMLIYDRFNILILILAILELFLFRKSIFDMLIGFLVVSFPLLIVALITNGIGGGDIKLMAVSGALLGAKNNVVAFIIAVIIGGIYGIIVLLTNKHNRKDAIPFGPFLCLGLFIARLYGPMLLAAYLALFF